MPLLVLLIYHSKRETGLKTISSGNIIKTINIFRMSEADLSSELNFDKKKKKKKTLALDLDEDAKAAELSSLEQRASKKF